MNVVPRRLVARRSRVKPDTAVASTGPTSSRLAGWKPKWRSNTRRRKGVSSQLQKTNPTYVAGLRT